MSNLFAIAGRPLSGKTLYIQRLNTQLQGSSLLVSLKDYENFENMITALTKAVMDNTLSSIFIDDFETELIKHWGGIIKDKDYKKTLRTLAGFADKYNLDIYFTVGLKRKADKRHSYYSAKYLRSSSICKEVAGIFYMNQSSKNGGK